MSRSALRPLSPLRRTLLLVVVIYFFAGIVSQKLIPGVDEIVPFFSFSLFSKVPAEEVRYTLVFDQQGGQRLRPPVDFFQAPDSLVRGNRYIGRKVLQRLGTAHRKGNHQQIAELRRLLEENYLVGPVRYKLIFERFDPLEKWRTGENRERRRLATYVTGEDLEPAL